VERADGGGALGQRPDSPNGYTGGKIQLTDAIAQTLGRVPLHVVRFEGQRYDCGNKLGFFEANVAFALARPDLKDDVITQLQRHGLGLQA
jgi:UTP-glucose-1-phosphate uridylyltransferase